MSGPRCVVIGAGRLAGGFVAPLLRAAGWEVVLVSRDARVRRALNERGGFWLRIVGSGGSDRWIDGVSAVAPTEPGLLDAVESADLLATSVGPSALSDVGRLLGPALLGRLAATTAPLNLITFENHRRAPELLALGLFDSAPALAGQIGCRLGIAGAAAWRGVSRRDVTEIGVRFDATAVDECYVDAAALVDGVAPRDGALPGLALARPFECRMIEKLWVFNAGHAAAAYLGWHAGCATVDAAMARDEIRTVVTGVILEARQAFQDCLLGWSGHPPIPTRPVEWILEHYADSALADPVIRVAREPRRKLAPGDRLIGPALACLAAGVEPLSLATATAAAIGYAEPTDRQAVDLQQELALLGPEEVLATVSMLDPMEDLTRLICARYRARSTVGLPR